MIRIRNTVLKHGKLPFNGKFRDYAIHILKIGAIKNSQQKFPPRHATTLCIYDLLLQKELMVQLQKINIFDNNKKQNRKKKFAFCFILLSLAKM